MALRDTSWITDSNAIKVSHLPLYQDAFFTTGGHYERTQTITTDEWILLTYDAAKNYADNNVDTATSFRVQEDNRIIGSYRLTRTTDVKTAWSSV